MKIKITSIYVDNQDKALRFYTEVLGLTKKADFSNGPFRWLTVASPDDANGIELQLALNDDPAAKAYQQAMFQQHKPAIMFNTEDVKADYAAETGHGRDHRSCERHLRQPHSDQPAREMVGAGIRRVHART